CQLVAVGVIELNAIKAIPRHGHLVHLGTAGVVHLDPEGEPPNGTVMDVDIRYVCPHFDADAPVGASRVVVRQGVAAAIYRKAGQVEIHATARDVYTIASRAYQIASKHVVPWSTEGCSTVAHRDSLCLYWARHRCQHS